MHTESIRGIPDLIGADWTTPIGGGSSQPRQDRKARNGEIEEMERENRGKMDVKRTVNSLPFVS